MTTTTARPVHTPTTNLVSNALLGAAGAWLTTQPAGSGRWAAAGGLLLLVVAISCAVVQWAAPDLTHDTPKDSSNRDGAELIEAVVDLPRAEMDEWRPDPTGYLPDPLWQHYPDIVTWVPVDTSDREQARRWVGLNPYLAAGKRFLFVLVDPDGCYVDQEIASHRLQPRHQKWAWEELEYRMTSVHSRRVAGVDALDLENLLRGDLDPGVN